MEMMIDKSKLSYALRPATKQLSQPEQQIKEKDVEPLHDRQANNYER